MYYSAKFENEDNDGVFVVSFRDVPECLTQGKGLDETMSLAEDVLMLGIEDYFSRNDPVPLPSEPQAGELPVFLPDIVFAKALLHNVRLARGMSKAELAQYVGVRAPEMQRILDPNHNTKLDTISRILAKLGKPLVLSLG